MRAPLQTPLPYVLGQGRAGALSHQDIGRCLCCGIRNVGCGYYECILRGFLPTSEEATLSSTLRAASRTLGNFLCWAQNSVPDPFGVHNRAPLEQLFTLYGGNVAHGSEADRPGGLRPFSRECFDSILGSRAHLVAIVRTEIIIQRFAVLPHMLRPIHVAWVVNMVATEGSIPLHTADPMAVVHSSKWATTFLSRIPTKSQMLSITIPAAWEKGTRLVVVAISVQESTP